MDWDLLMLKSYKNTDGNIHSVDFVFHKLNETGQFTGESHSMTVGPEIAMTDFPEQIKAICLAARIGYIPPEPERA